MVTKNDHELFNLDDESRQLNMNTKRHILNDDDKFILTRIKTQLTTAIESLKKRNVRNVNIEIELVDHIKKVLNEE